jgi:serine/threonine protein kinase
MEMRRFLCIATGLATANSQLHMHGLIHKDLKPPNVLVNPTTGKVWLTGFGIASRLPRERQSPEPPEFIAGTLAYMAPEQTGRMNRSIDARSVATQSCSQRAQQKNAGSSESDPAGSKY